MDGSNGKIVELLERIANGQDGISNRLDEMTGEIRQVNGRLDQTNARLDQTNARLDQTNARLDSVVSFLGRHHADHETRIQALEDRVFKQSG